MTTSQAAKFDYLFKYIIIGDAAVGKSNLLLRYVHGQFNEQYQATIGVEFGAKNLNIRDRLYRIQIWDTAGQENFKSITRAYYKNSVCALVVYDITKRVTFENVGSWIDDCRNQSPKTINLILIGNKSDLEEQREVTYEEGKELADQNGIYFYETSAKNGQNVEEVFYNSADEIARKIDENFYDLENEACGIKQGIVNRKSCNIQQIHSEINNSGRKKGAVMKFSDIFKKKSSSDVAKDRLKLVLVSDRASCSPEIMQKIRSDIIEVLSKYVEVDIDGIDINITQIDSEEKDGKTLPALYANIPIKNMNHTAK